jgi:hypothetical protein
MNQSNEKNILASYDKCLFSSTELLGSQGDWHQLDQVRKELHIINSELRTSN